MANRAHVPKFGDWQNDAPFTVVFDNARKRRTPNDQKENPDLPSNQVSPPQPPRTPNPYRSEPVNQTPKQRSHGHGPSREEAENRRFVTSSIHSDRNGRGRPQDPQRELYNNHHHQPYGGRVVNQAETNRRPPPPNPSPRPIPIVRGQQQYRPPAIPPFPGQGGNWNDHNTSCTHIFDKVREEKNSLNDGGRLHGGGGGGGTYNDSTPTRLINHHGQSSPNSPKTCCFAWSRKGKY